MGESCFVHANFKKESAQKNLKLKVPTYCTLSNIVRELESCGGSRFAHDSKTLRSFVGDVFHLIRGGFVVIEVVNAMIIGGTLVVASRRLPDGASV